MNTTRPERAPAPSAGIVVRQVFKNSDDRTRSPDIVVAPGTAAFDAAQFVNHDTFNWNFGQVPALGSANAVYVRGVNYTKGSQDSTVYLYAVTSDRLLDPTAWSAENFTVGGTKQNHTTITAQALYQIVATQTPVQWEPPKPAEGVHHVLVCWVDDSNDPKPPTFPTTPFTDLTALEAYVEENPKLALLDTRYDGVFLRQYPGQTPAEDGTGAQTSPDIVISGTSAARDAAAYASPASYNSPRLNNTAGLGARNFVYPRAVSTGDGPASARVYLYWAATAISPVSWQTSGFTVAGAPRNWVDLTAKASGEVMVATVPVVWEAPTLGQGQTCTLIAYIDSTSKPAPPDFTPFGYLTLAAVTGFVAATPRLAWVTVAGQPAPEVTMSWQQPVGTTPAADLYVGVQLHDIPADGSFALSVPGPDAANTVVVEGAHVPEQDALVAWPVSYPAGFATSAVLTYTKGATAPSGSPTIQSRVVPRPAT